MNKKILFVFISMIFAAQIVDAGAQFGNDYYNMMGFMGMGNFGWFIGLGFFGLAVMILLFLFWLFMLIDCLKRDFGRDFEKVVWVLVLIFLHILGAIVYYFVVKAADKGVKKTRK